MKKGKIVNVVLVSAVVVLLGFFAFSVRIRPVADNVAVLRATGMTCGGCSATIEQVLQANRGVASVEVDVAGGWVLVGYDSKKTRPEELAQTVTGAGYGSKVDRLLTVEQFRSISGRDPGEGLMKRIGCDGGCGARK